MLVHKIPYIGMVAGPFTAMLGATILFISANSGVMSASRLTFSMSQFHFITPWFEAVHSKYRTPARTIVIFSGIGIVQTLSGLFVRSGYRHGDPRQYVRLWSHPGI